MDQFGSVVRRFKRMAITEEAISEEAISEEPITDGHPELWRSTMAAGAGPEILVPYSWFGRG